VLRLERTYFSRIGIFLLFDKMTRILNHILLAVMAMMLVIGGGSGHETYEYSSDTDGSGKQSSDSNSNSGQGIGITIIVSSQGGTSGKQIWNQAKATSGQVHQVRSDRFFLFSVELFT
jgi:hypothetical protein